MKEQIVTFLQEHPAAWFVVLLLVPLAIRYRLRRFRRAAQHATDGRNPLLLAIGFAATAVILWLIMAYT